LYIVAILLKFAPTPHITGSQPAGAELQYPCASFRPEAPIKQGMAMLSRRVFIGGAAAAPLIAVTANQWLPAASGEELKSITADVKPISIDERRGRVAKVQALMTQRKVAALLLEPGSSLE
jgi:Xaa-Pro dipeptidase